MRTLLFLLLWLPMGLMAQSQPESPAAARIKRPRFTVKTNASTLLNPFKQSVNLAADFRVAPRWTVDLSGGYFLSSATFANNIGESYTGPRLRAGVKHYLFQSGPSALHVGLEGKYQYVRHISIQDAFRQGLEYTEILEVERKVLTGGLALRAGWQIHFGEKQRFFIEPYAGFGIAYHHVTNSLPPDAELVGFKDFIDFEYPTGEQWLTDALLGIHVGLAIW